MLAASGLFRLPQAKKAVAVATAQLL